MQEDDPSLGGAPPPTDPSASGSGGTSPWADPSNPIVAAYQRYLGRAPSQQEWLSQTGNGTFAPNDPRLQQSIQNIQNSPEANTFAANGGAATPPPGGAGGPGALTPPANPNTPNLLGVNTPTTPPNMLDLGGPAGLKYIPPTPDFSGTRPQFAAPTLADAQNDPGYQFRFEQGENALQNWAGAKGTLNDSSTGKALEDYGQAAGQQGYTDVWNRNFAKYQGDVGTWQTGLVNPTMQAWQTRAAAGEFQNAQNYNDWWNQIVNNQNNAKWFADHA